METGKYCSPGAFSYISACSLLSAEFCAVLEDFLFITYAGIYKSMLGPDKYCWHFFEHYRYL